MGSNIDVEICEQTIIHKDVVQKVSKAMSNDEDLENVADLFKIFGDRTRIRLLRALYQSEMCVCDMAYLLDMTQSAISHQLRILKQAKLVKNRKEGKVVYYSLADQHVMQILVQAYDHIKE
ncbi:MULTISPECIES: ArsR/SmtB family transcription factor [Sporolactobacillus]|jgi:ArsR family transcriptional regulator|nr:MULTISPECIES: metalloregulator ArsR/SmtB family transcription factor [Sporolactobacillus]KLI01933.1 ArsR family transcriptional regulator [Sporolactobacillus inulinus CASD]MCQ2010362.1 metalloregulator ArsR/SmtB family transcription factor [Sporolactobacillus sp. STSJ-5]RYL91054.1 ArsR family transcriptional regulator [Sporolactobacillus sp. THM7-4]